MTGMYRSKDAFMSQLRTDLDYPSDEFHDAILMAIAAFIETNMPEAEPLRERYQDFICPWDGGIHRISEHDQWAAEFYEDPHTIIDEHIRALHVREEPALRSLATSPSCQTGDPIMTLKGESRIQVVYIKDVCAGVAQISKYGGIGFSTDCS